jgi:hypothetical protein
MGIKMTAWLWLVVAAQEAPFDESAELAKVKRVYVDRFTAAEGSEQIRDLLLAALHRAKLFVVTENAERADAFLRGGGADAVFTEDFQYRDSIDGRVQSGVGRTTARNGRTSAISIGEDDSQRQTERKHEAMATVRLVNRDGDLIWSATRESRGSKVKAAAVDLVERIVEQLKADFGRARRKPEP